MKARRIGPGIPLRCAFLLVLGPLLPGAVQGQVAALPIQDLAFGLLQPGLPMSVPPSDASRRAEVEVRGSGFLVLDFVLPSEMVSAGGARLPIRFGSSDAIVEYLRRGGTYTVNPNTATFLPIFRFQRGVLIYLGGTVDPAPDQPPGRYVAAISIQISNLGT